MDRSGVCPTGLEKNTSHGPLAGGRDQGERSMRGDAGGGFWLVFHHRRFGVGGGRLGAGISPWGKSLIETILGWRSSPGDVPAYRVKRECLGRGGRIVTFVCIRSSPLSVAGAGSVISMVCR